MLPRRCILCCDTSITRLWHGQCVSSNALKAAKSWRAGFLNGSLRSGRISSSIGETVWSACLPDGSRVRRESHARFCERPAVKFHRPTQPHISGKDRNGNFAVKRHTIGKRMRAKLAEIKQQLRQRMHEPVVITGKWLKSVVQGYFNYHAVPGNIDTLRVFRYRVTRLWRQVLIRRGQKGYLNWARMRRLEERWIPVPRVLHPYPRVRLDAIHPR